MFGEGANEPACRGRGPGRSHPHEGTATTSTLSPGTRTVSLLGLFRAVDVGVRCGGGLAPVLMSRGSWLVQAPVAAPEHLQHVRPPLTVSRQAHPSRRARLFELFRVPALFVVRGGHRGVRRDGGPGGTSAPHRLRHGPGLAVLTGGDAGRDRRNDRHQPAGGVTPTVSRSGSPTDMGLSPAGP